MFHLQARNQEDQWLPFDQIFSQNPIDFATAGEASEVIDSWVAEGFTREAMRIVDDNGDVVPNPPGD